MNEASAAATDLRDLCLRMEDAGVLVRLDPDVEPSFWRNPILSAAERATLGSIGHVVRMGRVRRVGATVIELEQGSIPTEAGHVHVDCTAAGLGCSPNRTVFETGRITPQLIQIVRAFNAALIGWVEANRDDDASGTDCVRRTGSRPGRRPQPRPPVGRDAARGRHVERRTRSPQVAGHVSAHPLGNAREHLDERAINALTRSSQYRDAAIENLQRLLAEDPAAAPA